MPFLGGYVNSLEGIILEIVRPFLEDLMRTRTGSECTWTSDSLKKMLHKLPQISGDRRICRGSGTFRKNYFTSSDPHHDMLGGGCQVRVVIENMMGRIENLKTLISGFLGLVILVRWVLVTMFLS